MSENGKTGAQALETIRNIGIIAHIDAGKTTLSERFLYLTGKTHRLGSIDEGNTVMDYLAEERDRGITIVAAAASFKWAVGGREYLTHLIDTPGHIDFTAEVERSIRVSDGAIVIFSAVEGVEAQSEKVWRQSDKYNVPKIAFINKMDRTGASFRRTLEEISHKFTAVRAVPLQLPMGSENNFRGLIDLVRMRALKFEGDDGSTVVEEDIPEDFADQAREAREEMLLHASDHSDKIAEAYLEGREIPEETLKSEIRRMLLENKICPVMTGSAKKNIGVQPLLDAMAEYMPGPLDRPACRAEDAKTGEETLVRVDDPFFCGLVFKIVAGDGADLHYLRTYSGKLSVNDTLVNPRNKEKTKIKRILRLYAKNVEPVDEVGPGDIVGVTGPQDARTGDTLCGFNRHTLLESISFPEPVLSIAVEPRSGKDKDRLASCLETICREDPTIRTSIHESTGQTILSGMGELHLEVCANRIRNDFKVEAKYGAPQVAFRETLKERVEETGIFDRLIGETALHSEVDFILEPVERLDKGLEVVCETRKADQTPAAWLKAAETAMTGGLRTGGNSGYPLIYIRARITAIRGEPGGTTEASVAGAVLDGLRRATLRGTVMMEPIMRLEIIAPEDTVGEITGHLQARRAVIHGIETISGARKLDCEVPLAEMFGFSKALPKLSGGRASFSMEPCGYQEISSSDLERMAAISGTVRFNQ